MSRVIDERIVSMQFDNKRFEQNVSTTMSTLDKLKKSLNLDGAAKGLESISTAAKNTNFNPLGSAVDSVKVKFSALQIAGVTALSNLANQAVNTGKRVLSALTIDPPKTGLSEYETQIGAVQTILANTQSKGTNLNQVSAALDELNRYADKTIYNFTEMTRNIGTFTAAGVGLNESVSAIKGIANLAAISGSTSQQASTAMYQLSQALATGTVKLMDWNSVVNAGMGGEVFQTALKRTATQMGYNVDEMIEKYGSFRESLTKGEWLTAEVLTETLAQLSGAYSEADLIAQGYTEKQAKEIVELAKTAESAATDVKTFTQLMDTLKETAQSGWTQTWEYLIGDFEQAKELWSGVSEVLGGFINGMSEARNALLGGALQSNWDKLIEKINKGGVETSAFEEATKKALNDKGYNADALIEEYGSLEEVFRSGAAEGQILKQVLDDLGKTGKSVAGIDFSNITRALRAGVSGDDVKKVEQALVDLGYSLTDKNGKFYGDDGYYGTITRDAVKEFQKANDLKVTGIIDDATLAALEKAHKEMAELNKETLETDESFNELIDGITELGGREILIQSLKSAFESIARIVEPIGKAFKEVFPPATSEQLFGLIKGFQQLTAKFNRWTRSVEGKAVIDGLASTFRGLFSVIDIGWTFITDIAGGIFNLIGSFAGLGGVVIKATGAIGKWISGLRDSIKEGDIFGKAIDGIVGFLQKIIEKFELVGSFIGKNIATPGWEGFLNILKSIWNFVSKVGSKIAEIGKSIGGVFVDAFRSGDLAGGMDLLNGGLLAGLLLSLKNFFGNLGDSLGDGFGLLDNIKGVLDSVRGSLESWQQSLKSGTLLKIAGAIGILALSILLIASIDPNKLAGALGAISVLFAELMGSLAIFGKLSTGISGVTKGIGAMIGISFAVLILASALKKLSSMEWEDLAKGLAGVAGLMTIVVVAAKILASSGEEVIKGATQMVIFSLAIKILASACKDLSSLSWEELGKGLLGVGALMAGVALFMNNAKTGEKAISNALGIVLLSAAIKILASACNDFGQMSWEDIGKGLSAIGGLLIGLFAFTKFAGNAQNIISTGLALIAIGASMKIFASAIKDLSGMSWDQLAIGLTGMAGALLAVSMAMNSLPTGTFAKGAGLIVVSGALFILAEVLNKIGSLSVDQLITGLAGIAGTLILLSFGLQAMNSTIAGSAALLVAAGALAILTPVLKALGGMSIGSIITALATLAGVFVVLGVAGAVLTPIIPAIIGLAGAMALIGIGALAFGAGLLAAGAGLSALAVGGAAAASAIFTFVQQIGRALVEVIKIIGESATEIGNAVKAIVLALVDVFIECVPALAEGLLKLVTEVLGALAEYTPQIVDSLMAFLIGAINALADRMPELISAVTNLITSLFSGVADALVGIDGSTLAKTAIGVGIMAALIGMFSVLAPLIPGAIVGVLGMGVVIAELAVLLAAIGALAQIPGLAWLVGEGGEMMKNIGNALGKFVGGIVGGVAEGITSSLPQIGTDLSTFMTNLGPFIEGAKGISSEMLDGVNTLVSIITNITGANLLEGITSFLTGASSIESFGTQLASLATALTDFSANTASLSDADITKINTIAGIIDALVTAAGKVPASGGLAQAISGYPDMITFSNGLVELGGAITSFSTSVTSISDADATKIVTMAGAIDSLVTLASKIPAAGGLAQAISGYPDLVTFSAGVVSLGGAISSFSTSVADINEAGIAKITGIAGAVDSLVTLADKVPATGGLAQAIAGAPDLGKFAGEMATFGGKVAEFTGSVSEVTEADITKMTSIGTAAEKLVGVATSLSKYNGSTIFNTNLTEFAGELKNFGDKMGEYAASIADIKLTKSSSVIAQAKKLLNLAVSLAGVDTAKLGGFGRDISYFGGQVKAFYDKVADLDATKISNIATSMQTLSTISGDSSGLKGFIDSLGKVGTDGINAFVKSFKDATPRILTSISAIMTLAQIAIRTKGIGIATAVTGVVSRAAKVASSAAVITGFFSAGYAMAQGLALGISTGKIVVVSAAVAMAQAALKAAKEALNINSPSKEFMWIGQSVPEGFAKGIDRFGSLVTGSVTSMAENALDGTRNAIARMANIIDSNIDAQPVIRPVLDLSAVTAGAGSISDMLNLNPSVGVMSNIGAISSMMNNNQNGANDDVISAIKDLGSKLGNTSSGDVFNINGITYDDGSNVTEAVKTLVRAARMERRV